MNTNETTPAAKLTLEDIQLETQRYMVKVYGWMCVALLVTGAMAMYTASSESLINFVFGSRLTFFGLIILQFVAVGSLAGMVNKMSANTATLIFIGYSLLNGLTLAGIFVIYTSE